MKYCEQCGKEIMDKAVICPNCGCATGNNSLSKAQVDTNSIGWAILGFFIPLIGLILYLVWKDTRPNDAKRAGKGALISVIVSVVISIIYAVLIGSLIGSAIYYY